MGDVVADPSGSWTPSTAEAYIDQQVATVTGNLANETIARQTADQSLQNQINAEATTRANVDNTKADKATTLAGYGITNAYTKTEVNDLVDTPHQNYVTVQTYSALPASGSADTIYRVSSYDGSVPEVNVTKYSEYAWSTSQSQYIFLCVKSQIDEVFDITVYHSNTTYSDLAAALGTDGDNIPSTLRRGGMSVKYVQTSDNKYVQYRLMSDSFNTTEANWQGVDDIPMVGSDNLIKSSGVNEYLAPLQQETFSFQKLEETLVLGYYFNKSGSFTQASNSFGYKYAFVNKGEIVSCLSTFGAAYGGIGLFQSLPSSSSVADKIIDSWSATFIAPYDCYIVVTSDDARFSMIFIGIYTEDKYNTLPVCAEKVNAVRKSMCTWHSEDGSLPGYINSSGKNAITSTSWKILYIKVYKGDEIKFRGSVSGNYRAGYTDEEPTQGFALSEIIPTDTTSPYIATRNGYFCISEVSNYVSLEANNSIINVTSISQDIENIKDEIEVHSLEPLSPINKINEYYINSAGSWVNLESQQVKIYEITENSKYYLRTFINTNYALCAWFSNLPTVGSVPLLTIPFTEGVNLMQEAPTGANYLAITSYVTNYDDNLLDAFARTTVKDIINDLETAVAIIANKYLNKKCIYIGDSISTSNNYQWKGLIEDTYHLQYVRNLSGQLAPADGGITILPPQEESQTLSQKSIWYRCAENRMSIYDFDVISLFGGTNDMTNSSLPIGTDNDIPYVDNASGFDEGTVTDVRPETLTFASAFMGCIKMLQRDFPNNEIIICTVMPCSDPYGNWTDPVTNLPASEAIANLQVRIANKYGLKVIPFYWNVRTSSNSANNTFSRDGVHPNFPCALRMRAAFAEILCL